MSERKRCEQCGREGTRGFKTIGGFYTSVTCRNLFVPKITLCAATKACSRRWPKRVVDDV